MDATIILKEWGIPKSYSVNVMGLFNDIKRRRRSHGHRS